jgi:hypothetical protein
MNRLFSCSSNEVRRRAKGLSQGACLPPLVVGHRWLFFLRKESGKPIVLSAWCPALEVFGLRRGGMRGPTGVLVLSRHAKPL